MPCYEGERWHLTFRCLPLRGALMSSTRGDGRSPSSTLFGSWSSPPKPTADVLPSISACRRDSHPLLRRAALSSALIRLAGNCGWMRHNPLAARFSAMSACRWHDPPLYLSRCMNEYARTRPSLIAPPGQALPIAMRGHDPGETNRPPAERSRTPAGSARFAQTAISVLRQFAIFPCQRQRARPRSAARSISQGRCLAENG